MATMTVNCGSFDKYSYNGVTQYGTLVNFSIPAGVTITGCSVSFTTHAAGGNTADRAFSLNGARAHSSGSWAQNGALNAGLLSPGGNTFRATLKSTTPGGYTVCWWDISSITLTITYTEGSGGGGGGSTGGGGPVVISPSSINAGAGSVTVTCPAEAGIWHMIDWTFGSKSGSWSHPWEAGGTNTINIPLSWASEMPNAVSKTLAIRVRRSTTPAMPYSYATDKTTNVTIKVPASVVPSIGSFTASRIANNTPAGVSGYVQNVSGVSLAMSGVSVAYGSPISAYKITGAGRTFNASSGSISVLSTSGNIAFTAEVTDSRGRKATKVVGIDVLAYSAVTASNVSAYRSDASKNRADEGVFATLRAKMVIGSLDGQNTGEVKGRVYEKGTTPTAWTTMANDTLVLFGGSLSIEKSYTADILIADLITSYQYSIDIPTASVIMGIAPDGDGVSFGTYPESGKVKSVWPISAPNVTQENVFHNWDFRAPINQRGVSGAISTGTYFYDRWMRNSGTVTTNADYLAIGASAVIEQRIEGNLLAGKIVTVSVDAGGTVYSGTGTMPTSAGTASVTLTGWGTATLGYAAGYMYVRLSPTAASNVQAVKMELGTVSTLHLDPPMDHAVELQKCKRFFEYIDGQVSQAITSGRLNIPSWSVEKRVIPTIEFRNMVGGVDSVSLYNTSATVYAVTSVSPQSTLSVRYAGCTGLTAGQFYQYRLSISADL